ncbi:MAG: hypothetical protein RJA81_1114, partial [Planctomycetota bacterium]
MLLNIQLRTLKQLLILSVGILSVKGANVADPHSYAQPEKVHLTHLDLKLSVNFETKTLQGTALWSLQRKDRNAPLILDIRDLKIESITDP